MANVLRELSVRETAESLICCGVAHESANRAEIECRIRCGEFKAHRGAWKCWNLLGADPNTAWCREDMGGDSTVSPVAYATSTLCCIQES